MTTLRTLLVLFVCSPTWVFAQPGLPMEMVIRAEFHAFEERMRAEPVQDSAAAPLNEYVLAYTDHCDGGPSWITVGNGATLGSFLAARTDQKLHGAARPFFYGDRYAYVGVELPTVLMRYTHWFFELRER